MIISPSRFRVTTSSTRMTIKWYGPVQVVGSPMAIVSECTGHTCHSQHHVLWYLFHQPTTAVFLEVTYEFDIYIYIRKSVFLKVKGGSSIVPAHLPTSNEPGQSSSARCPAVWGPYDNESPDLCHLPIQWPTWPISSLGGALVDSVHVASAVSECGQSTV